jgi:hypothetical protein
LGRCARSYALINKEEIQTINGGRIVKGFLVKGALTAAVIVGPIVGISTGTANATPVYGGAEAIAYPWWHTQAQWTNLQIAQAYGPSNLYNYVTAETSNGCVGCNALAVNFQVDLVSYTNIPPNETDVANAITRGNGNDQTLAAAVQFVVTSPGRLSLSGSGWGQLGSIEWQLRSLRLQDANSATVQAEVSGLLYQVVSILQNDVTTTTPAPTPAVTPAPTPAVSPAVGTPAVTPAVAPVKAAVAPAPSSGIQVTTNVQINS